MCEGRHSVSVTLRNDLSELPRLSGIVEQFGAAHGLSSEMILRVNLALEEVIVNVISYAYQDAQEHDIETRLTLDGETLLVQVVDDGRPFNPLDSRPVDFDIDPADRAVGGLGIHLMRSVMDAVEYRRQGDQNVLVMRKGVRPAS